MLARLFDSTNPFWRFLGKLFDVALLNLLWLLTSLPIVTLGASTAALYKGIVHIIMDEKTPATAAFGQGFKENWKQATLIFLVFVLLCGIFVFDLIYFGYTQTYLDGIGRDIMIVVLALVLGLVLSAGVYTFLLQVVFENTLGGTMKNGFILMLTHLPRSFLVLLVNLLYCAIAAASLFWFPAVSILFILFGIGLPVFLDVLILFPVIQRYLPAQDSGNT